MLTHPDDGRMERFGGLTQWLLDELGIRDFWHASRDIHILNAMRCSRMFGYGAIALILAKYLSALGFSDFKIGLFTTLTLVGDLFLTFATSIMADHAGRQVTLMFWSAVMTASGIIFALQDNYYVLLIAAMLGVISPSGGEVGPFRGVEESIVAHLVESDKRTAIYNSYVVLALLGTAFGLPASGILTDTLRGKYGWSLIDAYRCVFWMYAVLGALNVLLALRLSPRCELAFEKTQTVAESSETDPLLSNGIMSSHENGDATVRNHRGGSEDNPSPEDRKTLLSISYSTWWPSLLLLYLLFMIDSFGSGMMPYSFINYYFQQTFSVSETLLGSLMSGAQFVSIPFTLLATPLTKRVGHIKAMVSVHLVAALFLALMPLPRAVAWAFVINYARSAFNSMDQAPRAAFVAEVVRPEERTTVNGLAMIAKTGATSLGPLITGVLMSRKRFWLAFVLAGAIKMVYDVGLLVCFELLKVHRRDKGISMEEVEESDGDDGVTSPNPVD